MCWAKSKLGRDVRDNQLRNARSKQNVEPLICKINKGGAVKENNLYHNHDYSYCLLNITNTY